MKIKVFISSPYSNGNQVENVNRQIDAADELMSCGFTCFIPLLSHFQHERNPRPYKEWLLNDREWLSVCDILLRLPGESTGADWEEKQAKIMKIPVFYSIEDLIKFYQ